ncbi:MAG TPA: bacteriohopanetetrol glucosamine biosynthesis glycosyltransferase HpnI [Blastocatellia bacterium]|jgi:ceramide glucosyltransferase|nr:bacteriohopanetetrol glucosamine biosynthesis glycosyltransferase HpnI [Blastocatellia bacterium]
MANGVSDLLYFILLSPFLAASAGGLVYYLLAIVAARKLYKARETAEVAASPAISLLKPLRGADPDLERHLESFFLQGYPSFEILFAVRSADDPAVAVAERLMERYPSIPARLILTGEPPYANAKVYSMEKMAEAAGADILVITDSDTSVSKDYLRGVAAAFAPERVGAATSLYRGASGADLWSKLEALGMSTEFMAGVVVANHLEGMKFTLGPSMAVRRDCLRAIGGFGAMADYLADDFVLGQWASDAGYQVALLPQPVNHHATALGFTSSFKHRLRWNRSSRFSRPAGYIGQGFTYGLPWALLLFLAAPFWWSGSLLLAVASARLWMAYELGLRLLDDRGALRRFWLIPMQDALSFATWIGGFVGREIVWRNERYRLLEGGRFEPVIPRRTTHS